MKKKIVLIVIVLLVIILTALLFDWGRRGNGIIIEQQNSSSTPELPMVVYSPSINQVVESPLSISGKARGNWFFEGTFPILLVDSNGKTIASTTGKATGDWATTSYVDFTASMSYTASSTGRALLIFSNDNPSGNPETSKSESIQIILK